MNPNSPGKFLINSDKNVSLMFYSLSLRHAVLGAAFVFVSSNDICHGECDEEWSEPSD